MLWRIKYNRTLLKHANSFCPDGKNKFAGQTGNKTCSSELRGARYASSKVTVTKNEILSWDQGFDKEDKQVWGATKGGYIFKKID